MTSNDYLMINKPSDTLVIHCVDNRFQQAFRDFVSGELGLEVFYPMVIAGGAYVISLDDHDRYGYIRDQIDFFITKGGVKRVVLINHDDCLWYKKENPNLETSDLKEKGKTDLVRAAINIKEKYPDIEVTLVWAELSGESIRFHKID